MSESSLRKWCTLLAALVLALASLGCPKPIVNPPAQPTPTPTVTVTPTPTPTPTATPEEVEFTSCYLCSGKRWETQTGIGWLHRLSAPWTTVIRFGGWDMESVDDTSTATMVANSRAYLKAIRDEGDKRPLIAVLSYWPGRPGCSGTALGLVPPGTHDSPIVTAPRVERNEVGLRILGLQRLTAIGLRAVEGSPQYVTADCELGMQLDFWAEAIRDGSTVIAFEPWDENNSTLEEAMAMRAYVLGELAKRGIVRPLYGAATATQILEGGAWQALDWVGIELYRQWPYTEPASMVTARADAQLERVIASGRKAVAVIESYSHNYDADPATVPAITHAGYAWAAAHKGDVVGTLPFSLARRSGALEYPDVLAQVKRGHSIFMGLPDPGPGVPPPPTPEPSPIGPGEIQPNSKAVYVEPGVASVRTRIVRLNGTVGAVTVDYATEDDTGKAGSEYVAQAGTLAFAPGQDARDITISLLPTLLEGTWQAIVRLTNATGGAKLVDSIARIGAWGKGAVCGFVAPVIKTTGGNSVTIALRREGTAAHLNRETRVKIEVVSGGDLGTAVKGVNYDELSRQWLTFAPGVRTQSSQLQLLAGGQGIWLTVRIARDKDGVPKIEPEGGLYGVSPTTGSARVEVH